MSVTKPVISPFGIFRPQTSLEVERVKWLDTLRQAVNEIIPPLPIPIQEVYVHVGTGSNGSTLITSLTTAPGNTEGDPYMSLSITPLFADSLLDVSVSYYGTQSVTGDSMIVTMFRDSGANAIMTGYSGIATATLPVNLTFNYQTSSGSTNPTTFKIRAGGSTGTHYFNSVPIHATIFGNTLGSTIKIVEYQAI